MTNVFLDYARYYDALYKDKDYRSEAAFIIDLILRHHPTAKSVLNIGCGTGAHDSFLRDAGYTVTGLDASEVMIDMAKKKQNGCSYHVGDARSFRFDERFDVVISLFHVLSYQTSNTDTVDFLKTIRESVTDDGVAIFDYWYGPAVLSIKPERRERSFSTDSLRVNRVAETALDLMKNVATVTFDMSIQDQLTGKTTKLVEHHPMRYFFTPEIDFMTAQTGLSLVEHRQWMDASALPDASSWAAYTIVRPVLSR